MEKTIIQNNTKPSTTQNLIQLLNQTNLLINGISEVLQTNDSKILVLINGKKLLINGSNIQVKKLDVEYGTLEATGIFDSFKYKNSTSIIKKIFK